MIEIYVKSNKNYEYNGDITLTPTVCTYKESEHELYLEHFLDQENRWKYIQVDNVISVLYRGKKLRYRIYNVIKSLYKVVAYAKPVAFDLIDTVLLDTRPENKTGQEALDIILQNTGFTGKSDITKTNTSYYVRKNIIEALFGDEENSFINRWGPAEYYFENETIIINSKIGSDIGLRVEFEYNLNEIEENIDTSEVTTRIIPVGYNGLMLPGDAPWVESTLKNKYPHVKAKVLEFPEIKIKDQTSSEGYDTEAAAQEALRAAAAALFANDTDKEGIDKPVINYKIDMINISNTTYYKDFKDLLTVSKGDTVTCYIKHLDINVKARIIDFEIDYLTGEYITIELGNAINNYIKDQADMQHTVNNITTNNGAVRADVLEGTIDALKTQFKATLDAAQKQDVMAILFENRDQNSELFGAMALGTQGFMIASEFEPGSENWKWSTFGTGKGFTANYITAGEMSANRVRAGMLESLNKNTWINMDDGTFSFANDTIKFDGTNFLINAKNIQTDSQGNMSFTGKLQPNDYQLRLFGDECKIDGSANAIRLQYNSQIYMAVDDLGAFRLFNQNSNGGTRYTSIFQGADGHTQFYNNTTMLKLLYGQTAQIQARNAGDNAYCSFAGSAFNNASSKKYKIDIKEANLDFIKILKENKINKYKLKDDLEAGSKLGFILEDLTEEAKEYLNPNNTDGIDTYSMVSMLWAIVQQQQKQIEELKGGI